jgi:hypothetical protein
MRSEAIGGLRAWTKERLGQQEQHVRTVERSVARLGELDDERDRALAELAAAVKGLAEMGLDETQLAEFVGTDLTALRSQAGRRRARRRPPQRSDAQSAGRSRERGVHRESSR